MPNTLWYHIGPKGSDLTKGIFSPYWMINNNMEKLALNSIDKYRNRMVDSWNIYPGREPDSLTLSELMNGLNKFRGEHGTKAIYLFRYPLASQMGPNMAKVLKYKNIYEIDISKIHDIIEIDYNLMDAKGKDWFENIKPAEYFSNYDDNAEAHGRLLFAGIPHISIVTKSGRIPPEAIKKLVYFPLYHGSKKSYSILKPHISGAYPDDNVVFASPRYDFALASAGNKWNDLSINQTMVDEQQILTEILPGSFNQSFNTDGYMHYISSEGFYQLRRKEYVSIWPAKPYKIEHIPNILIALKKTGVKLYQYPNLPDFIPDRIEYIKNICKKWNINPTSYLTKLK